MKRLELTVAAVVLIGSSVMAGTADRLRGKVVKKDGTAYRGLIRWGSNEASWYDVLDASKRLPESYRQAALEAGLLQEQQTREIRLLGLKIAEWDEGDPFPEKVQSGVRFGHLARIESVDANRARVIFKSGEEIVLQGSIDLGKGIRTIVVEDPERGAVELEWGDVELVELAPHEEDEGSKFGDRLFGTLLTRGGAGFTGFVCWDMDEMFTGDILDGAVNGEKRKFKFEDIRMIERADSKSATVTLDSGESFRVSGSNDVDDDNRDILILDLGLGQVRVGWDDFMKLVLSSPPAGMSYDFDGGHRLRGTVETEEGNVLEGLLRWDNDEAYSWEFLDGNQGDVQFDVELGLVRSIERSSMDSAVVTLTDGRQFELKGSNDVNEDNKGVFVTQKNGSEVAVRWHEFRRLTLDHLIAAERPEEQ